ncbi:CII family transcriptional regulator [Pantoea sp.]|uniref:CII family transcriptional regulator n=1 Tax=Pantoea sp. TaxID=69393 RepID=UPI0031D5CD6B
MEQATQSKNARRIESALLNKLASISQKTFAERLGIAEYQVSRMKKNFFRQMSMAIDILEYGIVDDDAAQLAKAVAKEVALILGKEKAEMSGNSFPA